jgi:YbbR domain-containing protein
MAALNFRRHVSLKLVSIALAFLLWLVVSGEQVVERSFRIPLEFSNLPAQLEIVGDPPEVIDVRVRGSSGLLSRVGSADLSAVIDMQNVRTGRRLFTLTEAQIRMPTGLEVVQVNPSTVAVTLEPSVSKVVPIVPGVNGDPAPGFVVGTLATEPSTVELVGPASALDRVREAVTEPVLVAGAHENVVEDVTVGPPDTAVRLRVPTRAKVTVTIVQAPVEWVVADVPVRVRGGASAVRFVPDRVTVQLRGPRELVTTKASDFEATIDIAGLGPGQVLVPVRVTAPERIGVVRVEPSEVRVRIP